MACKMDKTTDGYRRYLPLFQKKISVWKTGESVKRLITALGTYVASSTKPAWGIYSGPGWTSYQNGSNISL